MISGPIQIESPVMVKGRVRTVPSLKGLGSFFHIVPKAYESVSQPLSSLRDSVSFPALPSAQPPQATQRRRGLGTPARAGLSSLAPFGARSCRLRSTAANPYEVVTQPLTPRANIVSPLGARICSNRSTVAARNEFLYTLFVTQIKVNSGSDNQREHHRNGNASDDRDGQRLQHL